MKPASEGQSRSAARRATKAGYTLAEMLVTSAVFSLAISGFVYCQMFGMRQDQLVNSKIGASEQARMSFNDLTRDIRSAKVVQVGTFPSVPFANMSSFTVVPTGTMQKGNAIQLCMTTNTSSFWLYYFDTNAGQLRRQHTGATANRLLAKYLTNTMFFQAEGFDGTVRTDNSHKEVIKVVMQFYQYQYPVTKIGPGCYYDFYELQLRATPHAPDGK